MIAGRYHFSSRMEYFQELTDFARHAGKGDRMSVATMVFTAEEPAIGEMIYEMTNAARRGARVILSVDAFSFLLGQHLKPGPLWFGTELSARSPEPFGERFAALKTLAEAGGAYVITNRPKRRFTIPQAGRSHIKFAVLNDRIYIGGHNLERPSDIDVMAHWDDHGAADYLLGFTQAVVKTGSPRMVLHGHDVQRRLNDDTTLLIDAGTPRQSLILDEAWQLIDEAEERLFMTCQYFPGGRTGQHLARALQRGVQVTLYYSHPSAQDSEAAGHHLYALRERLRLPAELFTHRLPKNYPKLHAKVLVSEKAAMLGSHNYVVQGVRLGTSEIALLSKDPVFGQQLVECFSNL